MLDSKGFDLWADGYDRSVRLDDENGRYPFAGYRVVLNTIYQEIMGHPPCSVLDIGFGTGVLTAKLYDGGHRITGVDFSHRMITLAGEKMPEAKLIEWDFSKGLPPEIQGETFDFIISTYALHHLQDSEKAEFIEGLCARLNPGGRVLIGDVSFPTRAELEACRSGAGDGWDEEEYYFAADELISSLQKSCVCSFCKLSSCAGVFTVLHK